MSRPIPLLSLAIAITLTACTTPQQTADPTYPPDLALVITITPGQYASDPDPARRPAHYIVESDRSLHVAQGPGVHHRLYPPMTAQFQPIEMAKLHHLITSHELTQTADTLSHGVRYEVEITTQGKTHRYQTNPDASPGTARLIRQLASFHTDSP